MSAGPSSCAATAPRLFLGLLVLGAACAENVPPPDPSLPELGSVACKGCHPKIVETVVQTAHFRTSAPADTLSVKGSFAKGHNVLRTRRKELSFEMERIGGVLFQTARDSARNEFRRQRMDLVVGSGRVGQSYLYWRKGSAFQLPVSWLTAPDAWINSPGYPDGEVDFGRVIPPRCLECHSTSFHPAGSPEAPKFGGNYMLGISCARCHGSARRHVEYQTAHPARQSARYILNPARFSRERQLDNCALCHGGPRKPSAPSFSFKPGDKLDDFFAPASDEVDSIPDVHGNQVGLLRRSRCFRSSPNMTCSTCHDVHRQQRDVTELAQRCLTCHKTSRHPSADKIGNRMMTDCIDCHMPNQQTRLIKFNTPGKQFSPDMRSHLIGIYPEVSATVLQRSDGKPGR